MKVWCPWCRRKVSLRADGTFYKHNENTLAMSGSLVPECAGAGKAPREHPSRQRRATR